MNEVPQPIAELVDYLAKSGTGKAKLDKIIELGRSCDGAEQFLEEAKKVLPEGTLLKINTFIESKKYPAPLVPTKEQPQPEPVAEQPAEQLSDCPPIPSQEDTVQEVKEEPKQGKKKK